MDLGPHASFIWWAYTAAVLVLGSVVAWLVLDGRRYQRELTELEERGVGRRSAEDAKRDGRR